ncbi:hypothetical protein [Natrialba asiatica]|uniref:Uncharacterized protein n=1 Tax=Natrialba asiatica (strain ATCC 700177 / DSM 12278 / JCM 9576 / FERM P-10747 / NBRC 102637 / 172P1) TaxID=29540 RepID=M0AJC5_NATA1|nr:hypothetical protein [Natrialba asiatica]ELY98624.1 hypothetical protein C481_16897 [Natrialba asiatica DSM 12278]
MAAPEANETAESYRSDTDQQPNSMTRVREWLVVEGDRLAVAALISGGVFVLFVGLYEMGLISFTNANSVTRVASGMIAGTFSLVTLVVSINQLILSQEFASAASAHDQLEGVLSFRDEIAETASVPAAPASPTRLLELLAESIHGSAVALAEAVDSESDAAGEQAGGRGDEETRLITQFANDTSESSRRMDETLERSQLDTFGALSAAIEYDSPWQLYVARQIRGRYDDSLPAEGSDALDSLINDLVLFSTVREHFKTIYLQRELTRFSQLTILTGVPAILSSLLIGFLYADITGANVTIAILPYIVCVLVTIALSPLALLASYILRTAAVTRRTASAGPMMPQKDPDEGPFTSSGNDTVE